MVPIGIKVIHPHQIGVGQVRHGAGFPPEALGKNRVAGIFFVHDLGCHIASQPGINAAVNRRHATASDGCFDAVAVFEEIAQIQLHAF